MSSSAAMQTKVTRTGYLRTGSAVVALGLLMLLPFCAMWLDQPFYVVLASRILMFGLAAASLDLILGYGGMVSFGHASYLGLGAYVVAILAWFGVTNGFVHLFSVVTICALASFLIGLVALRTSDVYFIMITLAFSQMIYFLFVSVPALGGDDGVGFSGSEFGGVKLTQPWILYYTTLCVLALALYLGRRVVRSRFGMVVRGARSNERRMALIGFGTFPYRILAYVASAVCCGIAGMLLANQTLYVSPALMHWTRSGELLVMVVIGGIGTLVGPVIGAAAYLLFEEFSSRWTEHWQIIFGPMMIVVVLIAQRGLISALDRKGEDR